MKVDIAKYCDVPFQTRKNCMVCDQPSRSSIIDLPNLPMTEIFVLERINEKVCFVTKTCFKEEEYDL